jgi:hypothetical protein
MQLWSSDDEMMIALANRTSRYRRNH